MIKFSSNNWMLQFRFDLMQKIYVRRLQEIQSNRIAVPKKPSYWCFQADGIFCDSSQEEIYRVTTEDLVPK